VNIFQNFGIKSLTNDRLAFINIDEDIVYKDILDVLPRDKVVLEIVESTKVTKTFIDRIAMYHKAGYMFALDDFVISPQYFSMFMPLFPFVEYIKVDMKENCIEKIGALQKVFRGKHMKMLAEKVETREDFQFTRDLGFDLFQGFFFEKPTIILKKNIEPAQALILNLLSLLCENADMNKIEAEFRVQPELSLKLLKLINACSYCLRNEISSIRHALTLIGMENMRKWLTIMLYAGTDEQPVKSSLLETAMLRAHTLELLSIKIYGKTYKGRADAFFIGMLSYVDVVLGISRKELMDTINVKQVIYDAVVNRSGELGKLLSLIEDTDDVHSEINSATLKQYGLTEDDISDIKFQGLEWLAEQQSVYNTL